MAEEKHLMIEDDLLAEKTIKEIEEEELKNYKKWKEKNN